MTDFMPGFGCGSGIGSGPAFVNKDGLGTIPGNNECRSDTLDLKNLAWCIVG
jgi:hypothetical protein